MLRLVKRLVVCAPILALVAIVVGLPSVALGDDGARTFSARFRGIDEVPSVSTNASASLRLQINGSGDTATIDYTLTFNGLRAPVTQSHIHFGESRTTGAVVVFLCQEGQAAPAGTPSCGSPAPTSNTVTGHLTAAQVTAGAVAQGIAAGEMGRLVQAIRDGAAYANVHSQMFQSGEARGQIVRAGDNRDQN
jgi:CHRD domain